MRVKLQKETDKLIFTVEDTGVGITEEDKKLLFTEGGKGERSSAINPDSTGHGLFIIKQIVEAHGGRALTPNLQFGVRVNPGRVGRGRARLVVCGGVAGIVSRRVRF